MDNQMMHLLHEVLEELGTWCHASTTKDYEYILRRLETEGDEFLTITLPSFAEDMETCLDAGMVLESSFCGFRKRGKLPRFLGSFLELIFDQSSGLLLDNTEYADAVFAVRQICLLFGKVNLPCSEARRDAAIRKYVETEVEVSKFVEEFESVNSDVDRQDFRRVSQLLFRDAFTQVDKSIYELSILPKHGPGATADGLRGNAKYRQIEWTERLEEVFPSGEFLLPNWRYREVLDRVTLLEPGAERPVRVITVPKTLKTPRIIAVEPTCMQYAQQAILGVLVPSLQSDKLVGDLLGFRQQGPNRAMAQEGSLNGELATLDLSEASDRVSNLHVQLLSEDFPWFSLGLDASRSRKADVPGHGIIPLSKFASMGSAVCFPIEACVFLTLVMIGIERSLNGLGLHDRQNRLLDKPLTRKAVKRLAGSVRVYGDDIIVPRQHALHVIHTLESFGMKVNMDKTHVAGYYRESCGGEFYMGHDVSVVRCRELIPASRADVQGVISTVSMRNQFYWKGMWKTAGYLDGIIGRLIPYPIVEPTSPLHGRHSVLPYQAERSDPHLHSPLVKGVVEVPRIPKDHLGDEGALLKVLLKMERRCDADPILGEEPITEDEHLERSGRPVAVDMKLRWSSPF